MWTLRHWFMRVPGLPFTLDSKIHLKRPYLILSALGWSAFLSLTLFLTFNWHSRATPFTYHSQIWADKAGYYLYLPAALKYGFDPNQFPDSVETKTGKGFTLDRQNGKVLTKYTCGIALLQFPFYLLADSFSEKLGYPATGFSKPYQSGIDVAAVFYLCLGLFFLSLFLLFYYDARIVYLVLFFLFSATNLYYYAIGETGMSHVYSFALFSLFLFLIKSTRFLSDSNFFRAAAFGLLCGLIVLIRPSNIIFLSAYFFLDGGGKEELWVRLKNLMQMRVLLPAAGFAILVLIPQLLYWKYAYGSFIHYSYGEEGFIWTQAKLLHVWFSPHNGLFSTNPIYLIPIISLVAMIRGKQQNGIFILSVFLLISYIFSCWWDWGYGCAFGGRSFVEYLTLLSLPFGFLLTRLLTARKVYRIGFLILLLLLTVLNLKFIYIYPGCAPGNGDWDWGALVDLVF
jgi:hypothetical protein